MSSRYSADMRFARITVIDDKEEKLIYTDIFYDNASVAAGKSPQPPTSFTGILTNAYIFYPLR